MISTTRPKILVVDDEPANLHLMRQILKTDYDLAFAKSGDDAFANMHKQVPDLILLDVMMPGMDGYEVCDFVKKNPALSQVPVLLLTGAFEPFDQERAARVGCDGFLAKPFNAEALRAACLCARAARGGG